jgi:hypothetical protein
MKLVQDRVRGRSAIGKAFQRPLGRGPVEIYTHFQGRLIVKGKSFIRGR